MDRISYTFNILVLEKCSTSTIVACVHGGGSSPIVEQGMGSKCVLSSGTSIVSTASTVRVPTGNTTKYERVVRSDQLSYETPPSTENTGGV